MSKKLTSIVILALLMLFSIGFIVLRPQGTTAPGATRPSSTTRSQVTQSKNSGSYLEYSSDIIQNTKGRKLLFFHAPWCPQCRAIENDINEQGVPESWNIIKVDYDSSQDLRQKYGVTIQTTFVEVDNSGELIKKYVAYEEPTLSAVTRNFP